MASRAPNPVVSPLGSCAQHVGGWSLLAEPLPNWAIRDQGSLALPVSESLWVGFRCCGDGGAGVDPAGVCSWGGPRTVEFKNI